MFKPRVFTNLVDSGKPHIIEPIDKLLRTQINEI